MKTLLSIVSLLVFPLLLRAANPSFLDFNPWQFDIRGNKVSLTNGAQTTNIVLHGVRSSDGTPGLDAITGGVVFKDGLYTSGTIFGTNYVTNAVTMILSNSVMRITNTTALDFRTGPDIAFHIDSNAVAAAAITGLVVNAVGSGGLVRTSYVDGAFQAATNYANGVTNASIVRQTQATALSNALVALAYSIGADSTNFTLAASNAVRLVAGLASTNLSIAILQASTNYANGVTNASIVRQTQATALSNAVISYANSVTNSSIVRQTQLTTASNALVTYANGVTNSSIVRQTQLTTESNVLVALAYTIGANGTNYTDVKFIASNGVWIASQSGNGTNTTLRGLTLPSLTASRPPYINASGNLTNATGTPDGTKFLRDDGVLAVPAGGATSIYTNPNQFGASVILTLKDGVQTTNASMRGATNFGTAPMQSDAGYTSGDGTEYGQIGFLDASTGNLLVETWTNVSFNVTNVYNTPWPVGLGWCYQVASSNGFMIHWTNGPCGGAGASGSFWFDGTAILPNSTTSSVPVAATTAFYAADSIGTMPSFSFIGHTNYGMRYESSVLSFYVNGNRGGYWQGNGALRVDAELSIGAGDVSLTRGSAGVLVIDNAAGAGVSVIAGKFQALSNVIEFAASANHQLDFQVAPQWVGTNSLAQNTALSYTNIHHLTNNSTHIVLEGAASGGTDYNVTNLLGGALASLPTLFTVNGGANVASFTDTVTNGTIVEYDALVTFSRGTNFVRVLRYWGTR